MSIARIFSCDWRDCRASDQTTGTRPHPSFLMVSGGGAARGLHFCSWDCLLRHAAEKPPAVEVVPIGVTDGD
jgi:hypothetical protein